ncbi:hypothetical protein [Salmonella enterica]|uniref:hypothetical protein n=1 Tax=Salmonella enterica TaxID=28901 RepID=UPI00398C576B
MVAVTGGLKMGASCLGFWNCLNRDAWLTLGPWMVSQPGNGRGGHVTRVAGPLA